MTTDQFYSFSESYQCKNQVEGDLLEKLKTVPCHFTWKYDTAGSLEERISILKGKKTEYKTNESKIKLNQICYYCREIQLAFYESVGNKGSAVDSFSKASDIASTVSETHIKNGMLYVLECDQLFSKFLSGQYNECPIERVVFLREQFEKFGILERSVIMGIYAISLMGSGIQGCIKSVDLLRKLCVMDASTFEWPLRLGMALMRIREDIDPMEPPSEEELYNFRVAVSLTSVTENSSCRPIMYQTKSILQAGSLAPSTLDSAMHSLGIASSRGPDSEITIKFLEAIMHHLDTCKDKTILNIVNETLKDNNNSYKVNYIAGMILKSAIEYTRALYHLEKAATLAVKSNIFQLEISLIDLRFHVNRNHDAAISSLNALLEKYGSNHEKQRIILCLRGAVYMSRADTIVSTIIDWIAALGNDTQKFEVTFLKTFLDSSTIVGNHQRTIAYFTRLFTRMNNENAGSIQKKFLNQLVALFNAVQRLARFDNVPLKLRPGIAERQQPANQPQSKKGKKTNQASQQPPQGRNQPQNQQNQGWGQQQQMQVVTQNYGNNQQTHQRSYSANDAVIPIRINLDEFRTKEINVHVHCQCKCNNRH